MLLASGCTGSEAMDVTITATTTTTGDITITATTTNDDGLDSSGDGGLPEFPGAPLTFFIEESTHFAPSPEADGCDNDDVNNVGGQLQQAMLAAGWSGEYRDNADGASYHFIDPLSGAGNTDGQDGSFSDSRRVTVYGGHGNVNVLQWGQPGATPVGALPNCFVTIDRHLRLGTLAGDTSGAAIYATSCTGYALDDRIIETLGLSSVGQHFAWHNSPYISDGMLASFFEQTGTSVIDGEDGPFPVHNREAFVGIGQSKPGLTKNSPVMYTPGQSADEVIDRHYNARMRLGIGLDAVIPEPQDPDVYNLAWIDHGTSEECNP